jgi:hypothetical protein
MSPNRTLSKQFVAAKETITLASGNYFSHQLGATLTAIAEGINNEGMKALIKNIKVYLVAKCTTEDEFFFIQPLVVQTAGTFTDTDDQTIQDSISEQLDPCIDDEFGYQKIGNLRRAKLLKSGTAADVSSRYKIESQFDIPRNVVNLLNKEQSTERLQNLILGITGGCINTTATIEVITLYDISYSIMKKGITIR